MSFRCKNKRVHYEAKRKMTILYFFYSKYPNLTVMGTNFYHKEHHFLKFRSLFRYFLEIYLKIYDFALFKFFFLPTQKKHVHRKVLRVKDI